MEIRTFTLAREEVNFMAAKALVSLPAENVRSVEITGIRKGIWVPQPTPFSVAKFLDDCNRENTKPFYNRIEAYRDVPDLQAGELRKRVCVREELLYPEHLGRVPGLRRYPFSREEHQKLVYAIEGNNFPHIKTIGLVGQHDLKEYKSCPAELEIFDDKKFRISSMIIALRESSGAQRGLEIGGFYLARGYFDGDWGFEFMDDAFTCDNDNRIFALKLDEGISEDQREQLEDWFSNLKRNRTHRHLSTERLLELPYHPVSDPSPH